MDKQYRLYRLNPSAELEVESMPGPARRIALNQNPINIITIITMCFASINNDQGELNSPNPE